MNRFLAIIAFWALLAVQVVAGQTNYAWQIANLIDPAKLATLRERGANPRVQKAVYWLAMAQKAGEAPGKVLDRAVALAGYRGSAAQLTRDALLRNLGIAEKLGCLNETGLIDMRHGRAPAVMQGPYKGDELSVDHVIPLFVVPELDCIFANLELLPLRVNKRKNAKIGERQLSLAKDLHAAGLLSGPGLEAVQERARQRSTVGQWKRSRVRNSRGSEFARGEICPLCSHALLRL